MNDKCSSGTGAFIDMVLGRLGIPFGEIDKYYSRRAEEEAVELSATCTVFATSEALGHLANGKCVESVLRGTIDTVVRRISPLARRFNNVKTFTLTGGLSGVGALVQTFSKTLELEYVSLSNARHVGAIGAAVSAKKRHLSHTQRNQMNDVSILL